uniref:Putative secreted protein n=1 Tax=Anopheles darlingi TaxID=43151 RepID=A0A2M4DGM1_ANODA
MCCPVLCYALMTDVLIAENILTCLSAFIANGQPRQFRSLGRGLADMFPSFDGSICLPGFTIIASPHR